MHACVRLKQWWHAAGITGLIQSSQLTSLNLALCREITDAGVASMAELPLLHTLDLTFCDRITDASVNHLHRCAAGTPGPLTLTLAYTAAANFCICKCLCMHMHKSCFHTRISKQACFHAVKAVPKPWPSQTGSQYMCVINTSVVLLSVLPVQQAALGPHEDTVPAIWSLLKSHTTILLAGMLQNYPSCSTAEVHCVCTGCPVWRI